MNHEEDNLLFQLRGLRRDRLPGDDLWPGIAARIVQPASVPASGNVTPLRRRGPARLVPWALAASLVLAVGVAWQQRPDPAGGARSLDPTALLVQREARAMTREYDAALRELQAAGAPLPSGSDALLQLDRSAALIRTALARDPEAHYLLDRLRSTYEKRLALTQRLPLT